MLQVVIPEREIYDENNNEFKTIKSTSIQLEHSLVSVSKWESKWKKPFLGKDKKTNDEVIDYIRCMTISQNIDPLVYLALPNSVFDEIKTYIEDTMTATWFTERDKKKPSREVITSEIIYYWMITLQIPMECQKWHLNRLITLIKVCNIKNQPQKKMGRKEMLSQRSALNKARQAQLNSKG